MICTHVRWLEEALSAAGFRETYRGQTWSNNCREWVYFDVILDVPRLQLQFTIPAGVEVHENTDPKSGLERGLVCSRCHDAVMGLVEGSRNRFPAT
jgi:hypothetical protein